MTKAGPILTVGEGSGALMVPLGFCAQPQPMIDGPPLPLPDWSREGEFFKRKSALTKGKCELGGKAVLGKQK